MVGEGGHVNTYNCVIFCSFAALARVIGAEKKLVLRWRVVALSTVWNGRSQPPVSMEAYPSIMVSQSDVDSFMLAFACLQNTPSILRIVCILSVVR